MKRLLLIVSLVATTSLMYGQNVQLAIDYIKNNTEDTSVGNEDYQTLLYFLKKSKVYAYNASSRIHTSDEEMTIITEEIFRRIFADDNYDEKLESMKETIANAGNNTTIQNYMVKMVNNFEELWFYFNGLADLTSGGTVSPDTEFVSGQGRRFQGSI